MISSHNFLKLFEVFAVCLAFGWAGVPVIMRQHALHWTFAAIALAVAVVVAAQLAAHSIYTPVGAVTLTASGLIASFRKQRREPLESALTLAGLVRKSRPLGALVTIAVLVPLLAGCVLLGSTAWACGMVPVAILAWWTGLHPVDYRDRDLSTDLPPLQSVLQILAVLASILQEAKRGSVIFVVGLLALAGYYTSISLLWLAVVSATPVAAWWLGAQASERR